jgi:hypothetical protein
VSLKRRPVRGVGTGESRHAGRHTITLPSEEIVEIVIIERTESDRHNCQPIERDRQCSAARMRILDWKREGRRWEALVVWHDDAALKPVVKMDWLPVEDLIPIPVDPNWTGQVG